MNYLSFNRIDQSNLSRRHIHMFKFSLLSWLFSGFVVFTFSVAQDINGSAENDVVTLTEAQGWAMYEAYRDIFKYLEPPQQGIFGSFLQPGVQEVIVGAVHASENPNLPSFLLRNVDGHWVFMLIIEELSLVSFYNPNCYLYQEIVDGRDLVACSRSYSYGGTYDTTLIYENEYGRGAFSELIYWSAAGGKTLLGGGIVGLVCGTEEPADRYLDSFQLSPPIKGEGGSPLLTLNLSEVILTPDGNCFTAANYSGEFVKNGPPPIAHSLTWEFDGNRFIPQENTRTILNRFRQKPVLR